MPDLPAEATSTASQTVDAKSNESDGLTLGQAAAKLFAQSQSKAKAEAQKATEKTAPETSQEEPEQTQETVAEPEAGSAEKPTEESEAADQTTADQETEETEDDVLSNRTPLDEKTKQRIQKRIDKEVGKRKQLEGRLNELESLLREKETQQAQPPVTVVAPSDLPPNIAAINDLAGVEKLRKDAKDASRWAEAQLDAEADGETLPEGWDRKKLKEVMRNAKVALEDHIPQRETFIKQRQQLQAQAHKKFPFLTDRTSPDYQAAQAAFRSNPWLHHLPNADFIVGVQIKGLKALAAEEAAEAEKAKAKAAPAKPKVPVKASSDETAVSSTGATARVATATAQKQAVASERAKIEAKGHVTAQEAAAILLRNEQNRNSR